MNFLTLKGTLLSAEKTGVSQDLPGKAGYMVPLHLRLSLFINWHSIPKGDGKTVRGDGHRNICQEYLHAVVSHWLVTLSLRVLIVFPRIYRGNTGDKTHFISLFYEIFFPSLLSESAFPDSLLLYCYTNFPNMHNHAETHIYTRIPYSTSYNPYEPDTGFLTFLEQIKPFHRFMPISIMLTLPWINNFFFFI